MAGLLKSKRAISIMEIIAAIALLAVVTLTATSYAVYVKISNIKTGNYCQAAEFLVQQLEILSYYDYSDPLLSVNQAGTTHSAPLPDSLPQFPDLLKDRYAGDRQYVVTEDSWDTANSGISKYKKIVVTITWNDGIARSLTLTSLMRKK